MAPHSLTLTMVGAALLWVGWFGFNAGSNLEANGVAALAFVNTLLATAAAVLAVDLRRVDAQGQALDAGWRPRVPSPASSRSRRRAASSASCGALVIGLVGRR